jgi:glutathione synthase/RimK-type ligase-like ATP-grasp enzyme
MKRARVFNLCRTYGYQSIGYYVSLLAAARGHRPLPSVRTLQDLRQSAMVRIVSEELDELMQKVLATLKSDSFAMSIYFGRNMAKRYDPMCRALFDHFPAPLMRAEFVRGREKWRLGSLKSIATGEIPEIHRAFVVEQAQRYFDRPARDKSKQYRYDMAILVDPEEADAPSNEKAIEKFIRAADRVGISAWVIHRDDFGRLAEYDALFIRATTYVDHYTYRFSTRADLEGLVVIDDPISILRCTNKVYLAEVFLREGIPHPRTIIVHRDNRESLGDTLGYPVVLKRPDSAFSQGVVKAESREDMDKHLDAFFKDSELVVAQEYVPSGFDWRVGVLDGRALYVCRYYMAKGHWQIQKSDGKARSYGKVETLSVDDAPWQAIDVAEHAARVIGDGLYGVDLKEVDGKFVVMEVNDNPSLDSGIEDKVLGRVLYDRIMKHFLRKLETRRSR